jgi:hypothetical protein
MMVWLTVLGIAKRIGAWLTSLSFWQLACIGLALFAGVQTLRLGAEQRHAHKVEAQLSKAVEKLNAISSKRDQQKRETGERIATIKKQIRHADDQAKVIEQAPLPGNCKTPPEVMGADL